MNRIVVGLSGGVDSAVTVYLLKKSGYEVVGVFLEMLNGEKEFKRTEKLAKQLGIKLIKKDIQKIFKKEIIDKFVNNYKNGLTPNPCIVCNPQIKFKYLFEVADELRVEKVATGHYARVRLGKIFEVPSHSTGQAVFHDEGNHDSEQIFLQKAKDKTKDQSYFLYKLTQQELQRVEFPLGELSKKEVKKIAEKVGLDVPKSESQDVCFLKDFKNLEEFLSKSLNKKEIVAGEIVNNQGETIGAHKGLLMYTIGQRKGLNIGGGGPFYVVGKDFVKNQLIVSNDKQDNKLFTKEILIDKVNWINKTPKEDKNYKIKIRYQMKSVEATLGKYKNSFDDKKVDSEKWKIKCTENIWAVAPGQSLVVYDGDRVVGGGIIN